MNELFMLVLFNVINKLVLWSLVVVVDDLVLKDEIYDNGNNYCYNQCGMIND